MLYFRKTSVVDFLGCFLVVSDSCPGVNDSAAPIESLVITSGIEEISSEQLYMTPKISVAHCEEMVDLFWFLSIADTCPYLIPLFHEVPNNPGANVSTCARYGDGAVGWRYSCHC